jgi:hypothetical protein
MTLFWLQVVLLLIGTALHVVGRIYEVKAQQHAYYLDKWRGEFKEALEEAVTLSINGEHEKADEAAARLRLITNKYVMFFNSIN